MTGKNFAALLVICLFLLIFTESVFSYLPPQNGLEDEITNSIKSGVNLIGTISQGREGEISKGDTLSALQIAKRSNALSGDQVCVSLGKYANTGDWTTIKKGAEYISNSNQAYSFKYICDRANLLEKSIKDWKDPDLTVQALSQCDFNKTATTRYCVAVLTEKHAYYPQWNGLAGSLSNIFFVFLLIIFLILPFGISAYIIFISKKTAIKAMYGAKILPYLLFLAVAFRLMPADFSFAILLEPVLSLGGVLYSHKINESNKVKDLAVIVLALEVLAFIVIFLLQNLSF